VEKSIWEILATYEKPPSSYTGPQFDENEPIALSKVDELIEFFKSGGILHQSVTQKILRRAYAIFKNEPNIVDVKGPSESRKVTICGDVHGQFYDFLNIFEINGKPSEENVYIFNGDFVDRGSWSVEVILTMLALKLALPRAFFMTRGNHEVHSMNAMYGFEGEVLHKYGSDRSSSVGCNIYRAFREFFEALPLCHLIENKIFITHGGVPCDGDVSLDEIRRLDRHCQPPDAGIMCDLLWADPHPGRGLLPSNRGISSLFGQDVTERFCATNGLSVIVRSHEMKGEGYEITHGGKCVTIFSAPNYCDTMGNTAALINVKPDLSLEYLQFNDSPHPTNVRSMQYANQMMGSF